MSPSGASSASANQPAAEIPKPYPSVSEVAARVAEIAAMAGDPEGAHGTEDALYVRVLLAIADGCPFPRSLAATALQARKLDFPRWCA